MLTTWPPILSYCNNQLIRPWLYGAVCHGLERSPSTAGIPTSRLGLIGVWAGFSRGFFIFPCHKFYSTYFCILISFISSPLCLCVSLPNLALTFGNRGLISSHSSSWIFILIFAWRHFDIFLD